MGAMQLLELDPELLCRRRTEGQAQLAGTWGRLLPGALLFADECFAWFIGQERAWPIVRRYTPLLSQKNK